ncbi:MAG: C69 family dipeptidase [Pseudomonadales bacterium]|nr:C69 family dipeptidase [Pseudomonadales bacterium]
MLFAGNPALASLAVYVGKNLTSDGSVMLAGFGDEPSSHWLRIEPRQQYEEGATLQVGADGPAGWGNSLPGELIEIPQVGETWRYISMDYSEFAGFPAPLTNGGMNEHGLAVRDVALFSREDLVAMTPAPQQGPQYSDLARIALERARTAREAVEIAAALIEEYGFTTYGGNSHVFADPDEGWVMLEFAGGEGLWVARRLGPDDVWLNWRGYHEIGYVQTLPADWRDNPDYMASDNFISFAVEQGWHEPVDADGEFDVIAAYARPDQYSDFTADEAERVQAAVKAAAPNVEVRHLMKHVHAVGRDSSGYGQVAHLVADIEPDLRTLWVAPGPPLTAAFIPWRIGVESVPPEYLRHRYLTAGEDKSNVDPEQRGIESTLYANRAVKRLLYLVNEHRDEFLPEVEAALAGFEKALLTEQSDVERSAQILIEAGEPALARRLMTEHANKAANEGLRLIQDLAVGIEARTRTIHGIRTPEK